VHGVRLLPPYDPYLEDRTAHCWCLHGKRRRREPRRRPRGRRACGYLARRERYALRQPVTAFR
jgi:hypothetical protein